MPRLASTAFSAVLALAAGVYWPSVATAQFELSNEGMVLTCPTMERCGPGFDMCAPDQVCGVAGDADLGELYCHLGEESFVCCDPDGPEGGGCNLYPPESDDPVTEVLDCISSGDLDIAAPGGACNYKIASPFGDGANTHTFCSTESEVALTFVEACTTGLDGGSVDSWADGDCDGDGVSNGREFYIAGCDPCDSESLPNGEGGCMPVPIPDAGTDSGTDAGTDAGRDAGGDAGRDTGTSPDSDAGDFRGSGGCTCRVAGPSPGDDDVPGAWGLILLIALGLRSSRRAGRAP